MLALSSVRFLKLMNFLPAPRTCPAKARLLASEENNNPWNMIRDNYSQKTTFYSKVLFTIFASLTAKACVVKSLNRHQ